VVDAGDLVQDGRAVGELPLVCADLLDRGEAGVSEHGHDLFDVEGVVAREWLRSTHPAQLVEHGPAVLMRPLIALDRLELDL
jgi:hypothetical protein